MEYKIDIKEIRVCEGLSQHAFAEKYGIPVRTLQEWEQKRSKPPLYFEKLLRNASINQPYPSIDELFAAYDGKYKAAEMSSGDMVGKELL